MKTLLLMALAGFAAALPVGAMADSGSPQSDPFQSVQMSPAPALTERDRKQMADEVKQGVDDAAEVVKQAKLVSDKTPGGQAMIDRVSGIGQRLAAVVNTTQYPAGYGNDAVYPFVWHFHVVEDKEVNAFSLPGGQVYVNTGLLKQVRSDDELAGVLGHEMTHSAHHHLQALSHEAGKMNSQMLGGMLAAVLLHVPTDSMAKLATAGQYAQMGIMNNKYSETAERDADHGGTLVMAKAGYNPVGMLTFMERLGDFENASPQVTMGIFQDHPEAADRVAAITSELGQMKVPVSVGAVREATDAPHATFHAAPGGGLDIVFVSRTLPTLADPDENRVRAIVAQFNALLDGGLQLFQIGYRGSQVVVSDRALITILPADLALHPGETPESLARTASEALRGGLYAQSISSRKL